MKSLPNPILSTELKPSQLPEIRDWSDVIEFAATFREQVEFPEGLQIRGLVDLNDDSSIAEIRAALFVEYRRYNHYGHYPSDEVLQAAQAAVHRIRSKLN